MLNWAVITLADVHRAAAAVFKLPYEALHGDKVTPDANRARQIATLICTQQYAVAESARLLGMKIKNSRCCALSTPVSKMRARMRTDEELRRDIALVRSLVHAHTKHRRRIVRFDAHLYENTLDEQWEALCENKGEIENGQCRTCSERNERLSRTAQAAPDAGSAAGTAAS